MSWNTWKFPKSFSPGFIWLTSQLLASSIHCLTADITTWRLIISQGFNWHFAMKTSGVCLLSSVLVYFHCPVHTHKPNIRPDSSPITFSPERKEENGKQREVFSFSWNSDFCYLCHFLLFTQEYTKKLLKLSLHCVSPRCVAKHSAGLVSRTLGENKQTNKNCTIHVFSHNCP